MTPAAPTNAKAAELVALLARDEDERDVSLTDSRIALRRVAALLSEFDPAERVAGFGEKPENWLEILPDSAPVDADYDDGHWRLDSNVRRRVLEDLGSREAMRRVLDSIPSRPDDPVQRAIERIVRGSGSALSSLPREDLAALAQAGEWFEGVVEVPDLLEIEKALPLTEVLAPLRKLDNGSFVGRINELVTLEDYVGSLEARSVSSSIVRAGRFLSDRLVDRPPLFVFGPGGVGKSTLIAHFVLTHVDSEPSGLSFVYLDIDRMRVDPTQPLTLLLEAIEQLGVQISSIRESLSELAGRIRRALATDDASEALSDYDQEEFIADFAACMNVAISDGQRLLFVLDTFEEVQFLGLSIVKIVWDVLEGLQTQIPSIRIVVAGRAAPSEDVRFEPLPLGELDRASAALLLGRKLDGKAKWSKAQGDEILALVGCSPLAVSFAADIVKREGLEQLRSIESRNFLFLKIKSEKIIAQLYGRILAHIHDPNIRKLAFPGLIVRRITPDVIAKVLVGPCAIDSGIPPVELFEALRREVALVEPDGDDAVRHRADVRRLMLSDLLSNVSSATAAAIDRNAVDYYARQSGVMARAEEIYHRLRLGEDGKLLDSRWLPGLDYRLRGALDELGPSAKLWLSRKLKVTPPKELLAQASQEDWEIHAQREAERYIQHDAPQSALKILRERKARMAGSPLFRLEAEAELLQGNSDGAFKIAQRGYESAIQAGRLEAAAEVRLLQVRIAEGQSRREAAFTLAEETGRLLDQSSPPPLSALLMTVARIRIRRQLSFGFDKVGGELIVKAKAFLTPKVLWELRNRPSLLTDVAAELGQTNPELFSIALDVGAFDARKHRDLIVQAISQEPKDLLTAARALQLVKALPKNLESWLDALAGGVLLRLLQNVLSKALDGAAGLTWLAEIFRGDVSDTTTRRTKKKKPAPKRRRRLR